MTKHDRLGGALREVEAPLGRALREHAPMVDWIDDDLQLSYSQCGLATAALQLYLAEQCDVVTHRRIASLPMITPKAWGDDPLRHVILSTEDRRTIDPTYTQFFELVGYDLSQARRHPDVRALLPERKIALFSELDELAFGEAVARRALLMRARGLPKVPAQPSVISIEEGGALEDADVATVVAAYQSIWRSQAYTPFTVEAQSGGYGDDAFENTVRNIVDAL